MKGSHRLRSFSSTVYGHGALAVIAALISLSIPAAASQDASPQRSTGITVQGTVRNSGGSPVAEARVRLEKKSAAATLETTTNAAGAFVFSALEAGSYRLSAQKSDWCSRAVVVDPSSYPEQQKLNLVLEDSAAACADSSASSSPSMPVMELADKPNFTIAGVTDWTAAGGHGSFGTKFGDSVVAYALPQ